MNHLADLLGDRMDHLFPSGTISPTKDPKQETTDVIPQQIAIVETPYDAPLPSSDSINVQQITAMLHSMRDHIDSIIRALHGGNTAQRTDMPAYDTIMLDTGERILEGVFNGEAMIGADGKTYAVPPNYASKSKLVEGDLMKLTITNSGKFIYKQIAKTGKKTISGELVADEHGRWSVLADGRLYRVLNASVTFYKAQAGDEVFILVPEDGQATWGAVEQVIHKVV